MIGQLFHSILKEEYVKENKLSQTQFWSLNNYIYKNYKILLYIQQIDSIQKYIQSKTN